MKKGTYILETEDFRIISKEIVKDRNGNKIEMRLCEELAEGRWEAFYSIRKING